MKYCRNTLIIYRKGKLIKQVWMKQLTQHHGRRQSMNYLCMKHSISMALTVERNIQQFWCLTVSTPDVLDWWSMQTDTYRELSDLAIIILSIHKRAVVAHFLNWRFYGKFQAKFLGIISRWQGCLLCPTELNNLREVESWKQFVILVKKLFRHSCHVLSSDSIVVHGLRLDQIWLVASAPMSSLGTPNVVNTCSCRYKSCLGK